MKDVFGGFLTGRAYNSVNTTDNAQQINDNNCDNDISTARFIFNRLFRDRVPHISRPLRPAATTERRPSCSFVLLLVGIVTIAIGCFVLVLQPYDIIFKWRLQLGPGGETYELWRKPPVELYLKVHLFNITNAEEFLRGDHEVLNVVEVGPYVYKEDLEHSNVTFNANGTLTTIPLHPLKWVPELSNGTEEDILTLPNIALLSIANVIKDKSYFARMGLNLLIRQTDSHPIVRMTAKEFMFGYESPLVTLGNKFMSSWIHFDKLGLIDRMYDFDGDYSTVFTGETDIGRSGLIDTYNGATRLPHWTGDHCSNVHLASDSTKFPSFIEPNQTISFYRKSVCRAVPLKRIGESVVQGLASYDYTFVDNSLDNGAVNPDNKCFCRNGKCLQHGLIDVTECYYGFPIAVSYPHFYDSDPALLEMVNGSKPDKEKHASIFKIEPQSGLPLHVAARFQINLALGNLNSITRVEQFTDLVLPMLWTEIRMESLPSDLNTLFQLYLNILPAVQLVSVYLLFAAGSILLLVSICKVVASRRHSGHTISMHPTTDEDRREKRCSSYLDHPRGEEKSSGGVNSREMELYYSSLLSNLKESDIV